MTARVAVIVLAAGRSRRFDAVGYPTKVVVPLHGVSLVRIVATTAFASRAVSVAVVTGPGQAEVANALHGLPVQMVHNAGFASGQASSLQAGLASLAPDIDGVLIMLADMPFVAAATLDRLIARFDEAPDKIHAVVPVHEGRRGNPVLIGQRLFGEIDALSGDKGARRLLSTPGLVIDHCTVDDPGVTIDIDTAAELAALQDEAGEQR